MDPHRRRQLLERQSGNKEKAVLLLVNSINGSLELFPSIPGEGPKPTWADVKSKADEVLRQATKFPHLLSRKLDDEKIQLSIQEYFHHLQTLLILCYASVVGAGPTLYPHLFGAMQNVANHCLEFMMDAILEPDSLCTLQKSVAAIGQACAELSMSPSSNATAISKEMKKIVSTLDDHCHFMKTLLASSKSQQIEASRAALAVMREASDFIWELSHILATMSSRGDMHSVSLMEKLLILCEGVGESCKVLASESYSAKEVVGMREAIQNIRRVIPEAGAILDTLGERTGAFDIGCNYWEKSLGKMLEELDGINIEYPPPL